MLILVADSVRFVFHLLPCRDSVLYSLSLCFALYMLDAELPLSCENVTLLVARV